MNIDLTGKTALVTASSAGIGFAIARGLAESGALVILNGRSEASVARAKEKLQAAIPQAQLDGVAADLSDATGTQKLIDALANRTVDILVNNAGIYELRDFLEAKDTIWERHWQTNVMSGVRLSRALVPGMVQSGWGRIVFISSESSRNIPTEMIHYGVTKTSQLALSRGLAKRVAGSGVTVNAVLPGPTISDGFAEVIREEVIRTGKSIEEIAKKYVQTYRNSSLLQRAASVEEVANLVVYVCSTQASATSGAALRVDGGVIDDIV